MANLFEAIMVICFGLSWPVSVHKSWKSRTAKGKSLIFEVFICIGYIFGIIGKLVTGNITYVFIFYVINVVMVSVDMLLYLRNRRLDREAGK